MFENEDFSEYLQLSPVGGGIGARGCYYSASPVSPLEGIRVVAEGGDELESISVVSFDRMEEHDRAVGSPASAGLSEYLGLSGEEGVVSTGGGEAAHTSPHGEVPPWPFDAVVGDDEKGDRSVVQSSTAPERLLGRAQGLLTDIYAKVGRAIMPAVHVMQSHELRELCSLDPKLETIVGDLGAIISAGSESPLPLQAGERAGERPFDAIKREVDAVFEASKDLTYPHMEGVRGSVSLDDVLGAEWEDECALTPGLGGAGAVTPTDGGVVNHEVGSAGGVTFKAAEPSVTECEVESEGEDGQPGRIAPPMTLRVAGDPLRQYGCAEGQDLVSTTVSGEVGGGSVEMSREGGQAVASQSLVEGVNEIGVAGLRRSTSKQHAVASGTAGCGAEEAAHQPLRPAPTATGVRGSCNDGSGLRHELPPPPSTTLTQEATGPTTQHTPHASALTTSDGDTASSSGAASTRDELIEQVRGLREEAQAVTRGMKGEVALLRESQQSLRSTALRAMGAAEEAAKAAGRRDCCRKMEEMMREYTGRHAGLEQFIEREQERHSVEWERMHDENLQLTIDLTRRNAEYRVLKEAKDGLEREVGELRRELAETKESEQMLREAVAVHEVRQGEMQVYCRTAIRQAELQMEEAKRADARAEAAERAQWKAEAEARDAARQLKEEQGATVEPQAESGPDGGPV